MATNSDLYTELECFEPDVQQFREWQQAQQYRTSTKVKIWVLLGSFVLFVAAYASIYTSELSGIAIILGVLALHEMGHFLAMRSFGYQNTSIFFLPFFGAAVTGYKRDATLAQRFWMLLAGPLPGILLGIAIAIAISKDPGNAPFWLVMAIVSLLLINFLNLLPIYPLDGGKIANLLLCRYPNAEVWLKVVSVVVLVGVGLKEFPLLIIALLVAATIPTSVRTAQIYNKWQRSVKRSAIANEQIIHAAFKAVYDFHNGVVAYEQRHRLVESLMQRAKDTSKRTTCILLSIVYTASLLGTVAITYQVYQLPGWQQLQESNRTEREFWQERDANSRKMIADANEALRLHPHDLDALYQRANYRAALFTTEDTQAAIRDYDQILRIQPSNKGAYLGRGHARTQLKDDHGAIQDYEQALRLYPDDSWAYHKRGDARRKIGDFEGAIADYEQVIRLDGTIPMKYSVFDQSESSKPSKSPQALLQEIERGLQHNPQNVALYWQRGEVRFFALDDEQGALQDYNQALRLRPEDAQGYLKRAVVRFSLLDIKGALADCDQALRLNPQSVEAYTSRIAIRSRFADSDNYDSDRKKNIEDVEKVLSLQPEAIGMHLKLAQLRGFDSQAVSKTISDYSQVLRLYPNDVDALRGRAESYYRLGKYQNTIQDCDRVLHFKPNEPNIVGLGCWELRGLARYQLKDYNGAIQDYTQGLQANNQDPHLSRTRNSSIYEYRGDARYQLKDYQGAINDYSQALQILPKYASYHLGRAKARYQLGDYKGTIADTSSAIRLQMSDTRTIEAYTLRSQARQQLGDKAGAIADRQSADNLSKQH